MIRERTRLTAGLWPEKRCATVPCMPKALVAAAGVFSGGADVQLGEFINKSVIKLSCGVRITERMLLTPAAGRVCGHFSVMWLPGTWVVVPQLGGTWSGVLLAGAPTRLPNYGYPVTL